MVLIDTSIVRLRMLEVSIFATAVAAVAQSAKRPELRSFKEVVQS